MRAHFVVIEYGYNGDGGSVFASAGGSRDPKDPVPPPIVALTPEHYNRIERLAEKKIPTKIEFDIPTEFLKGDTDSLNVVGDSRHQQEGRGRDAWRALG